MRKREIEQRFDAIVDFSGVEQFIDTPIKRYSSGMRLRLGFAVAHLGLCRRLRAELGPWAVSGPAAHIGAAALADDHWLAEAAAKLADEARRLDALLQASGFDLQGGTPLFRLASHGSALSIVDALGRAGTHVRRFPSQPSWLRFGLPGSEQAWQRLATALS